MLKRIFTTLREHRSDRLLIGLLGALLGMAVLFALFVAIAIEPSDVQVVTHYTAFGPTNFYRTRWSYLILFALFAIVFAVLHGVVALKLAAEKGRPFAIGFLWLSLALLGIFFIITVSILNIAAL